MRAPRALPGGRLDAHNAHLIKLNTVRIEAAWPSGNAQYGFGFIVGERASTQLYIATANHVVRDHDRGKSTSVKVWLRGEGTASTAELLDDSSQALDLAVLRVAKPQGFTWTAGAVGSVADQQTRATAVWFIGRDRDWFTPVTPGRITLFTFESKLQLEGMQVRVGSSGAPLVADSGIIGMLISDEGDTSYGIPIEKVQQAFLQWSFPFSLSQAVSTSTTPAPVPTPPPTQREPDPPQREPAPASRPSRGVPVEPEPGTRTRGGRPAGAAAGAAVSGRGRMISNQKIFNVNSGLCLSPAGGSKENNAEVVQYLCDDNPSRLWAFNLVNDSDIAQIVNMDSGLCLTVAGGATGANTTAVQYTCDRDPSRRWRMTTADDRSFRLVNMNSNLCLTIAGGGTDRNRPAVQYPCDGHPSRDWQLRPR